LEKKRIYTQLLDIILTAEQVEVQEWDPRKSQSTDLVVLEP
jgi:hypothetical protein